MEGPMPDACKSDWRGQRVDATALARMVREAARHAALDAVNSVLVIAADRTPDAPERVRDITNQVLDRAMIMQREIDRFIAAARKLRR